MDEYTKLRLKKLTDEQKEQAVDYLMGITEDTAQKSAQEIELETMSNYTKEAIELNKNWGAMQGVSCGYKSLDKQMKGLVGGELTIIAGKTSYGKTQLAINIANEVALKGIPTLFVSLEMSKKEIASRFMRINGGEDTDDYNAVATRTVFQKTDELNWTSIDKLVGNFCEEFANGLVVIDHLHYFTRELDNVAEDLGRITKELKKNAIRHDVPIILISHVRKTNQQATIEDLRGSSYIAQDADIVLMVGRKEEDEETMFVTIEKNRNRGYDFTDDVVQLRIEDTKLYEKPIFV